MASLLAQLRNNVSVSSAKKSVKSDSKSDSVYSGLVAKMKEQIAAATADDGDGLFIVTADDVVNAGICKATEYSDKRSGIRDYLANNWDLPVYPAENRLQAVRDLVGDGMLFVVSAELAGTDKEKRDQRRAHFAKLIGLTSDGDSETSDGDSETSDGDSES